MKKYTLLALSAALWACTPHKAHDASPADQPAPIYPDYIGVTIPPNIAPLNFNVVAEGLDAVDVTLTRGTTSFDITGSDCVRIPREKWHKLIAGAAGDSVVVTVRARIDGAWTEFLPFSMYVSADSIDNAIAYRLIAPGYEAYNRMGIYCRNLSDYTQTPILENVSINNGCINCHSFNRTNPAYMSMHVRGPHGGTLLRTPAGTEIFDTKTEASEGACVYPYWHPDGRFIAYSNNNTAQLVHCAGNKNVEVFDLWSDLAVYDTETRQLILPATLRTDSLMETFPAFSPDGERLYYCSARSVSMPDSIDAVRYDLMYVPFNRADGSVGTPDTLLCASALGKSATLPRPSPDGRFLAYTLADHGTFPIWHHEADLWMLDLASGQTFPLDAANSADTESYHSWSRNGRWLVFSSRRDDGQYTRPYFCHIDSDGHASRPFMLPQENPLDYYTELFMSYNIPEFVNGNPAFTDIDCPALILSDERSRMSPNVLP